jgi:uncharacterized protein
LNRLVVLDTNILVSAGLTSGPPARVVEQVLRRELSLIIAPGILREYVDVMHRPKFRESGFPPGWLDRLLMLATRLPVDPAPWPFQVPDSKDAIFLALAKASGGTLITGNLRHYPEEARYGVQVHSPQEYLTLLAQLEAGNDQNKIE